MVSQSHPTVNKEKTNEMQQKTNREDAFIKEKFGDSHLQLFLQ